MTKLTSKHVAVQSDRYKYLLSNIDSCFETDTDFICFCHW